MRRSLDIDHALADRSRSASGAAGRQILRDHRDDRLPHAQMARVSKAWEHPFNPYGLDEVFE